MALTLSKHNHRRCPPCKAIAPEIEKLAKEHEGAVVFLKVDVDKAEDAAADNGISAMPTFILFKDEKKVGFPESLSRLRFIENQDLDSLAVFIKLSGI